MIQDQIFEAIRMLIESKCYRYKCNGTMVVSGPKRTLLDKPERRHSQFKILEPNFCGFTVRADAFVVGHGIDYEEKYRNYPHVSVVKIS